MATTLYSCKRAAVGSGPYSLSASPFCLGNWKSLALVFVLVLLCDHMLLSTAAESSTSAFASLRQKPLSSSSSSSRGSISSAISGPSPSSPPAETPQSAQQKLDASKVPLNIAFAGLALYSLIGLLTLVAMIFPPQRVTPTRQSQIVQRLFSIMVILFCLLRLVYFCFPIAHVSVNVTYVVNQIAFMVFFSMFSLIIFFWAEQYHRKFYDTQSMLPRLRNVFIVVNIILWLLEIVLVTLAVVLDQVPKDRLTEDPQPPLPPSVPSAGSPILTLSEPKSLHLSSIFSSTPNPPMLTPSTNTKGAGLGGAVYFSSVILVIVVDFIFAVGFAIYGIAIFLQKYTYALGSGLRRELIQTMLVTIVFAACFALRMVMFLYRPITGKFINGTLYRVLAYFIPEVVAVTLQVSVVYLMNHSASSGASNAGTRRAWRRHGASHSTGAFGTGSNGGSIQRPSVEDDVYYAADQDLRASAMPAPLANAHERLISPPRPLRTNFSSNGGVASTASITASAASSMQSNTSNSHSNTTNNATSQNDPNMTQNNRATISNAQTSVSPTHVGMPIGIASQTNARVVGSPHGRAGNGALSGSFTPLSFSPTREQPLLQSSLASDRLPLQDTDGEHGSRGEIGISSENTDEDSDALEIDDTASLIPKRHSRRS